MMGCPGGEEVNSCGLMGAKCQYSHGTRNNMCQTKAGIEGSYLFPGGYKAPLYI